MMNPVLFRNKAKVTGRLGVSFFSLVFLHVLAALLLPLVSVAGEAVTAAYTQSQGTMLAVKIQVGSPPPPSLILVQKLPSGVRLLNAQPSANTVNTGKGEVKWLLRDITPGTFAIRMTLDRAVTAGDISAEIRYMSAQGGGMQALPVAKP